MPAIWEMMEIMDSSLPYKNDGRFLTRLTPGTLGHEGILTGSCSRFIHLPRSVRSL